MPPKKRPNALWADWLVEAATAAADKNSRAAESYLKAARALRACPQLLSHPNDAEALSNIGPKAVSIITKRLEVWCQENNAAFPRQVQLDEPRAGPSTSNNARRKKKPASQALTAEEAAHDPSSDDAPVAPPKKVRITKDYMPKVRDGAWGILAALYSFCEPHDQKKFSSRETIVEAGQRYCTASYDANPSTGNKTAWNSGIDTLRRHELVIAHATLRPVKYTLTRKGFDKAAIVAAEEDMPLLELLDSVPHKNTTTVTAPLGRDSKTATTSVKRKLSVDASSQRWVDGVRDKSEYMALDDDEWEASLLSGDKYAGIHAPNGSNAPQPHKSRSNTQPAPQLASKPKNPSSVSVEVRRAAAGILARTYQEPPVAPPTDSLGQLSFQFYYLDQSNHRVKTRREAEVQIVDEESYKVEFCTRQRLHPFKRHGIVQDAQLVRPLGPEGPTMMGWLRHSKSVPVCPGFLDTVAGASRSQATVRSNNARTKNGRYSSTSHPHLQTNCPSESEFDSHVPALTVAIKQNAAVPALYPVSRSSPSISLDSPRRYQINAPLQGPSQTGTRRPRASFATATTMPAGLAPPKASAEIIATIAKGVTPDVWPAGTYTISLIIDNREVKSKNDRDGIYKLCVSKAEAINRREPACITVEQRALAVGDALWIAVQKGTRKEVVLDSIVERKRLDDLCASILDARFHEQKARLKKSGLRDRIYLVESYNAKANKDQFGQQIQTSKSELMLLDDCHLHETPDWKASVDYLVMRTDVLNQVHKTLDLSVIPDRFIDRSNYLPLLAQLRTTKPKQYWVTSYSVFHSLNDKSSNLTISSIWARMINNVSGMSAEKISDFVDRWPTPRVFWDQHKSHGQNFETEADQGSKSKKRKIGPETWIEEELAKSYRRIGPALSKKIWDLFDAETY